MHLKVIIAISLAAAVPVCAQAQSPSVPRVSKDDAKKVVTIIRRDQAKIQTYCDIQKLGEQLERAYKKRDMKLVDELLQKIETLEKTLGPEYAALIDRLGDIDLRLCRYSENSTGCVRGKPQTPGSKSKIRKRLRPRVLLTGRFDRDTLHACHCGVGHA
jgi:flagellar motility protein MotE (MotC chaperone)